MSVYKTQRKEAVVQFLSDAKKLRITTIRIIKRFPTSYRWICTNKMLELAEEAYISCVRANDIYIGSGMDERDYDLRHRYFMKAYTAVEALLAEITFLYELVDDGNSIYKSRSDYDKAFYNWIEQGNITAKRIHNVIKSDKQRYKKYFNDSDIGQE